MDENDFRQKLIDWGISVKSSFVPTTASIRLYGHTEKTFIVSKDNQHLIYDNIKPMELSDELYKKLSENMKMNDIQILKFVQKSYVQYLKDTRKQIVMIQKDWSRNFAHYRARVVIEKLGYDNIYHICDLTNSRVVPIEILLKIMFDVYSKYGEHRRIKDKSEVYIDPRVLRAYNNHLEEKQRIDDLKSAEMALKNHIDNNAAMR